MKTKKGEALSLPEMQHLLSETQESRNRIRASIEKEMAKSMPSYLGDSVKGRIYCANTDENEYVIASADRDERVKNLFAQIIGLTRKIDKEEFEEQLKQIIRTPPVKINQRFLEPYQIISCAKSLDGKFIGISSYGKVPFSNNQSARVSLYRNAPKVENLCISKQKIPEDHLRLGRYEMVDNYTEGVNGNLLLECLIIEEDTDKLLSIGRVDTRFARNLKQMNCTNPEEYHKLYPLRI